MSMNRAQVTLEFEDKSKWSFWMKDLKIEPPGMERSVHETTDPYNSPGGFRTYEPGAIQLVDGHMEGTICNSPNGVGAAFYVDTPAPLGLLDEIQFGGLKHKVLSQENPHENRPEWAQMIVHMKNGESICVPIETLDIREDPGMLRLKLYAAATISLRDAKIIHWEHDRANRYKFEPDAMEVQTESEKLVRIENRLLRKKNRELLENIRLSKVLRESIEVDLKSSKETCQILREDNDDLAKKLAATDEENKRLKDRNVTLEKAYEAERYYAGQYQDKVVELANELTVLRHQTTPTKPTIKEGIAKVAHSFGGIIESVNKGIDELGAGILSTLPLFLGILALFFGFGTAACLVWLLFRSVL